jgi:hypothetical protein
MPAEESAAQAAFPSGDLPEAGRQKGRPGAGLQWRRGKNSPAGKEAGLLAAATL